MDPKNKDLHKKVRDILFAPGGATPGLHQYWEFVGSGLEKEKFVPSVDPFIN
jgi:hypothetical protein